MLENFKKIYSPNFDIKKRKPKNIKFIILHYTGMKKEKNAIKRLTNVNSKVSCHYFITYSGKIIQLVPDLYISWHAGISRWKRVKSLNFNSIGVEISNPGHDNNYVKFKNKQIKVLSFLITQLKKKYNIQNKDILGHSDIAPDRKKDPGEKFPWKLMKKKNISIWHNVREIELNNLRNQVCTKLEERNFFYNLKKLGYRAKSNIKMIKAFQRRFRQKKICGKIDKECLKISTSLIKEKKY